VDEALADYTHGVELKPALALHSFRSLSNGMLTPALKKVPLKSRGGRAIMSGTTFAIKKSKKPVSNIVPELNP
jgi:hypothetical protein